MTNTKFRIYTNSLIGGRIYRNEEYSSYIEAVDGREKLEEEFGLGVTYHIEKVEEDTDGYFDPAGGWHYNDEVDGSKQYE